MTDISQQAYKNESAHCYPKPLLLEASKPAVRGDVARQGSGMCGGLLPMSLQAGGLAPSLDALPYCHSHHLSRSTSLTHTPI